MCTCEGQELKCHQNDGPWAIKRTDKDCSTTQVVNSNIQEGAILRYLDQAPSSEEDGVGLGAWPSNFDKASIHLKFLRCILRIAVISHCSHNTHRFQ